MSSVIELVGLFAVVFAVSFGMAYIWAQLKRRQKQAPPPENSVARMRASGAVYRTRFVGVDRAGWRFSCPLQRDAYVPIRVGESLTVECQSENGVRIFRTEVVGRDALKKELILRAPDTVHVRDRRSETRRTDVAGTTVDIDGVGAVLADLSSTGLRVVAARPFPKGERVSLRMMGIAPYAQTAWVIGCEPNANGPGYLVRLKLEETLDLSRLPKAYLR
ncbi:MAG: flagellar brake protein [Fimbriimonadaceae bacterium]